jgi:hypothetical protein
MPTHASVGGSASSHLTCDVLNSQSEKKNTVDCFSGRRYLALALGRATSLSARCAKMALWCNVSPSGEANKIRHPRRPNVSIPKETLLHAYRTMKTIREFEERVNAEIMNGQIPGFTHL